MPPLLVVELPGDVGQVDGRVVLPLEERVEAVLRAQSTLLLLVEYGVHFLISFHTITVFHIGLLLFLSMSSCICDIMMGGNFELRVKFSLHFACTSVQW